MVDDSFAESGKRFGSWRKYYRDKQFLTLFEGACLASNKDPDLMRSRAYPAWRSKNEELDAFEPGAFKRMFDGLIVSFVPDDVAGTIRKIREKVEHPLQASLPATYVKNLLAEISYPIDLDSEPAAIPALEQEQPKNIVHDVLGVAESLPPAIRGATIARLQRAIAAFPTRYPQYSERFPKLDSDVRPWLKEAGIAANDREVHVFSSILSEHFAASPDTRKP